MGTGTVTPLLRLPTSPATAMGTVTVMVMVTTMGTMSTRPD